MLEFRKQMNLLILSVTFKKAPHPATSDFAKRIWQTKKRNSETQMHELCIHDFDSWHENEMRI